MRSETRDALERQAYQLGLYCTEVSDSAAAIVIAQILTESIHSDLWPTVMRQMSDERLALLHETAWAEQERRDPSPASLLEAPATEAEYRAKIGELVSECTSPTGKYRSEDLDPLLTRLAENYAIAHSGQEASAVLIDELTEHIATFTGYC